MDTDDLSFMISENNYTYCDAKQLCENVWHGVMSTAGRYSFMGLLAQKFGLPESMPLEFWLESPRKYINIASDTGRNVALRTKS